jgi:transcription elongation factor Elf1
MPEYQCPKCGSTELTSVRKMVNNAIRVILCKDCGYIIGTVNDMSDIHRKLDDIVNRLISISR